MSDPGSGIIPKLVEGLVFWKINKTPACYRKH